MPKLNVLKIKQDACERYGTMTCFARELGISLTRLYVILEGERVYRKNGVMLPSVARMLIKLAEEDESIWKWIL